VFGANSPIACASSHTWMMPEPSPQIQRRWSGSRDSRLALAVVAVGAVSVLALSAPILAAGYGADNDSFLMLGTWDLLLNEGRYVPSRYQGYPLAELGIGIASEIGGHWLSGFVSVALGFTSLALTYGLLRRRTDQRTDALLLVTILAMTPAFVLAATTSIDYLYGLAPFLAGWYLLERGCSPVVLGLVLGLSAAGRLTYLPLGILILLLNPNCGFTLHRRGVGCLVAIAVTMVTYFPAFVSADWSLAFLDADRPTGQGVVGLLGRSTVKGTFIWGLLGTVLVAALVIVHVRRARRTGTEARNERWLLAPFAFLLILWFWLPVEPSYLLPAVVILLAWISGSAVVSSLRPFTMAVILSLTLYGWLDVQLLGISYGSQYGVDGCEVTEAVSAEWSPHFERGPLFRYPAEVRRNLPCNEAQRLVQANR
jgi:hypothetical protein